MTRLFAILALAALAACNQQEEPEAAANVEATATAPAAIASLAKASRSVAWVCEKDTPITAIHGTNAQGDPDLALIVEGRSFTLQPAIAASGIRFTTAEGLSEGQGLMWWEKGNEARLHELPADKLDDPAAGEVIRTCRLKDDAGAGMDQPPK